MCDILPTLLCFQTLQEARWYFSLDLHHDNWQEQPERKPTEVRDPDDVSPAVLFETCAHKAFCSLVNWFFLMWWLLYGPSLLASLYLSFCLQVHEESLASSPSLFSYLFLVTYVYSLITSY